MQNKMRDKKVKNSVLAEKFGVSLQTIRNARKGITQSELAEQIRQEVVELTKNLAVEKKIIMTVPGSIGKMTALFGVTRQHINRALKGIQNSSKCREIRKYALKNGGVEY